MRTKQKTGVALLAVTLLGTGITLWWVHDSPRRESLASLARLEAALCSGNRTELLDSLIIPAALRGRAGPEQWEFLAKALSDEISSEGLNILKREASYGPLKEIFPDEALHWTAQANVNPDECVAFKLWRNGVRAEVVLVKPSRIGPQRSALEPTFRILRVNNIKQMAAVVQPLQPRRKVQ